MKYFFLFECFSTPPKLPSRKAKLEVSDPQFLVQRMKELEDWLYE